MLVLAGVGSGFKASAFADHQTEQYLQQLRTQLISFNGSLNSALASTSLPAFRAREISDSVRSFESSVERLRQRNNEQRETPNDVREVLDRATQVDSVIRANNLFVRVDRDWRAIRATLDGLARQYSISQSWDNYPDNRPNRPRAAERLTGTYRLNLTQSDRAATIADQATRHLTGQERQRIREMIIRRLEAPESLALERTGRNISMASSRAPQVTFEADGVEKSEQRPNGRTVRTMANVQGDRLIISTVGDRGNDYTVTFDPVEQGRRLRVNRRLDIEQLTQPVVVNSIYDKTSETARLDIIQVDRPQRNRPGRGGIGFTVQDGSELLATLNTNLNTERVRDGERFTMTVVSPREFDGATIEGYVSKVDRAGRFTGRAELGFNFERIRLRNGRTYDFDGYIQSVRAVGGEEIQVDNEGVVSEESGQTQRTVTRGGIGAAIGAVIGAIAGGGKGAAVGAVVGGGAGAGSVFVTGRDDLDLRTGTEFRIRAVNPNR